MSGHLQAHVDEYLRLRRAVGFKIRVGAVGLDPGPEEMAVAFTYHTAGCTDGYQALANGGVMELAIVARFEAAQIGGLQGVACFEEVSEFHK